MYYYYATMATMPEPPPVHVPVEGVGWDIRAVPCERTDMEGRVIAPPEPLEDPRSPSLRVYDHPEVEALRAELAQNNGINGLEIFSPDDDPAEICRVYRRDGFVVVRDCLSVEQLELLRSGCSKALQMIMDVEPDAGRQIMHETGRLPHRYSYGSSAATRQQSAWIEWASLVDLPTTTPILEQIFGGLDNYAVGGMGGEIALPPGLPLRRVEDSRENTIVRQVYLIEDPLQLGPLGGIALQIQRGEQRVLLVRRRAVGVDCPFFCKADTRWTLALDVCCFV